MALKIILSSVWLILALGCKSNLPDKAETAAKVTILGAVMLPFVATAVVGSLFSDEKKGNCRIEIGSDISEVVSTFGSPYEVLEVRNEKFSGVEIYKFRKQLEFHSRRINQYKGSRIERIFCRLDDEFSEFYIVEKNSKVIEIYTGKERMAKKYL